MIKAILACDDKGGVGKDGTLPWPNNPRDLKWFKDKTTGHMIVMGSTTWLDPHMPCPMPNRINVVATTNRTKCKGAHYCIDGYLPEEIRKLAKNYKDDVWVIGGPKIIEQSLGCIEEFYISRIPGDYDCDSFLPLKKIETLFELIYEDTFPEVTFEIWRKKK